MQLQFLLFHNSFVTWSLRFVLILDLALIWWLWGTIRSGRETGGVRGAPFWVGRILGFAVGAVYWGGHDYYERIDPAQDPNGPQTLHFNEGNFFAHDVADFGFLDLVRLGVVAPDDINVSTSLAPSASASDGNSVVQVTMADGDFYFHRYNHDNYGESDSDCTGWPADPAAVNRYGRFWPVLSGERGEYEIANGRSASVFRLSCRSTRRGSNATNRPSPPSWRRSQDRCSGGRCPQPRRARR
jgi:hypothetical protein